MNKLLNTLITIGLLGIIASLLVGPTTKKLDPKAIEGIDFKAILTASAEQESCGPESLDLRTVSYGDVTGDGDEEAVVEYWNCNNGTGGGNSEVYTLTAQGKLANITPELSGPMSGFGGHGYYSITAGNLLFSYPIYNEGDPNADPTGGENITTFKWNGEKFVVETATTTRIPTPEPSPIDTSAWLTYTNPTYHIVFNYPPFYSHIKQTNAFEAYNGSTPDESDDYLRVRVLLRALDGMTYVGEDGTIGTVNFKYSASQQMWVSVPKPGYYEDDSDPEVDALRPQEYRTSSRNIAWVAQATTSHSTQGGQDTQTIFVESVDSKFVLEITTRQNAGFACINSTIPESGPGYCTQWTSQTMAQILNTLEIGNFGSAVKNNEKRQSDVNTILNAVNQYTVDHWDDLRLGISTVASEICKTNARSCIGLADLRELTKNKLYLIQLPFDPICPKTCKENGTGYTIQISANARITVSAPHAELGEIIQVTR